MSRVLKALAWISPQAALSRARALAMIEASTRYAGATTGRRGASFRGGAGSANAAIGGKLSILRERSHEMVRDHWAFSRILDVTVGHAVGAGISILPDNGNDRVDRIAKVAFEEWAASADISGENDLNGLLALAVRGMLEGGNTLTRMVPRKMDGKRKVPLALQLLEGEHIDHTKDGKINGKQTRLGVVLGDHDERLGYWVFPQHPGENTAGIGQTDAVFLDRAETIHLYRQLRPGQILGVPVFAPILLPARDLDDLMEAVIIKAKIEACFSAFVTKQGDGGPLASLTSDKGDRAITEIAPGVINHLREGESITFAQPTGTSHFESINLAGLYAMAAGAGVTYDQMTGDLRQANYSSLRAGKIEFRRQIEQLQWLTIVPKQLNPITRRFTETAILAGALKERKDGYRWKYVMPANEPIDPKKDLEADILAVRAGRMSPQEFIAGWGRDWREVIDDFASFLAEIDKKGLVFDFDPRKLNKSGSEHPEPPAASGSQE